LVDMIGRNENSAVHHWRHHLRHAHNSARTHDQEKRR
jgi:hypothetical protein